MTPEVSEPMGHDPGSDNSLKPHVTNPHSLVAQPLRVRSVASLNNNSALSHFLESAKNKFFYGNQFIKVIFKGSKH